MVEGAGGPRLQLESAQPVGVGGDVLRQHLDRDVAPEPGVARAIDLAHPSRPEGGDDLVGADAGAGL